MKFWKKSLLALGALTCLALPSLSSCNSIAGGDNIVFAIERITAQTDTSGRTILTIYYTNEAVDPLTITIPAGIAGEDGVGVADVTYVVDEKTQEVTLTITYTDPEKAATEVKIPAIQGIDGLGVESIELYTNESGNNYLRFHYTDGSVFDLDIPEPLGISNIVPVTLDDGSINLTITYTDGSRQQLTIPPGNPGRGILTITCSDNSDEDEFTITITYTTGEPSSFTIPKPHATQWRYGNGSPSSDTIGDEGDYYIDVNTGWVYCLTETLNTLSWERLFCFRNEEESAYNCIITFDPQGGTFPSPFSTTSNINQSFIAGTYIRYEENVCIYNLEDFNPTRDGYTFAGWYTDTTIGPNTAHFTNITAVPRISSLTLYAQWTEVVTPSV